MDNRNIIENFYDAFAAKDVENMLKCYHPEVTFEDPAFGLLNSDDARNMWRMLLSGNSGLDIHYAKVDADQHQGSAQWVAKYIFSKTGRRVTNYITAHFEFKDGLIYRHRDHFSLWNWTRQALGLPGLLFGWGPWTKSRLQKSTRHMLEAYKKKTGSAKN